MRIDFKWYFVINKKIMNAFLNVKLRRRNTLHGSQLMTINHEYDEETLTFHSDRSRRGKGRKSSYQWISKTEKVTSLMISCQQELEHDVHTILLKKVITELF